MSPVVRGDGRDRCAGRQGNTTWPQAHQDCINDGTHLIVIDSATENAFAESILATMNDHVWLGAGDHYVEGTFQWITGQPLAFTAWHPGEPNNALGVEDCIELDIYGMWNDEVCQQSGGSYHHICECDGTSAIAWCNTDSDGDCGTCGNACMAPQVCMNQACL